jgi:hypothetical protein
VNVHVRIGRLVLDGVDLSARERVALTGAVERELARTLAGGGPAQRRRHARRRVAMTRVDRLGADIARAVHADLSPLPRTGREARR